MNSLHAVSSWQKLASVEAPPPILTEDIIGLAVIGGLGLLFVIFAVLFVVKSRRKRIAELTEALEDHRVEGGEREALPEADAEPEPEPEPEPVPVLPPVVDRDAQVEAVEAKLAAEERRQAEAEAKAAAEAQAAAAAAEEARAVEEAKAVDDAERKARLRSGLSKTRTGFIGRLSRLFGAGKAIDADMLEELEQVLVTSDVGVKTADHLLQLVKKKVDKKEIDQLPALRQALKQEILELLSLEGRPLKPGGTKPMVVMVVGVNGGGKTTTIGKLAHQLKQQGHSVVLGAGDTFRAAAADQLDIWAQRSGTELIRGKEGADPSSVLFDAVKHATEIGADVVIADTAGRLHTKVNLMEELKKVQRVLGKACAGAPHESLLVLDATTGQNAIAQASQFNEAIPLTGIVLTKLDGTAKGGVIVGVSQELKIPVRYIGIGEKLEDLRPFHAEEFVDALFAEEA